MTTTYDLYLESGPRQRKTMTHVLDLLGCVATGPTTAEAVAATPDAIRAYLRFLQRHGEAAQPDASFETRVVEHITEGDWLGNGSPYLLFEADLQPVSEAEIDTFLRRFGWLRGELADWVDGLAEPQLDETPAGGGRPTRAVLLHVLGPTGSYLSTALGGLKGFSALHGAAERGELGLAEALCRSIAMVDECVRAATPEQRAAVHPHPKNTRTLRKGLRRLLEHDWEHFAELARRPGRPAQ